METGHQDPLPKKAGLSRGIRERIQDRGGRGREERGRRQGRRDPKGGTGRDVLHGGGGFPPPEKNTDIPYFTPECAHMLLQGVYGDFPHHNCGYHLEGRVADNTIWQHR